MKFDNEIWKIDKSRRNEIESKRKLHQGLSFELKPIEKSPVTEGYRNKCEFTVGIDDETKLPTVGFRLGSYVTGTVGVGPIQAMIHISEQTKKAVLVSFNHHFDVFYYLANKRVLFFTYKKFN